jgi:hypothetical protein
VEDSPVLGGVAGRRQGIDEARLKACHRTVPLLG